MKPAIGILAFDGMEELDFAGPYEVFAPHAGAEINDLHVIAPSVELITCAKGLGVMPTCGFDDAPALDVLVVPGGEGTRRDTRGPLVEWIAKVAPGLKWLTSVCTGAFLLEEAGLLAGRRVTTHWAFIANLRERGNLEVLEAVRYVRDGNVVTSAGVSAGIDMALWLTGQLHDPDIARRVQRIIQYDPAPPYSAEV